MTSQAYDINEILVPHGKYGHKMGIIMEGTVELWRDIERKNVDHRDLLDDEDREPVFGMMACLNPPQYAALAPQVREWQVMSNR